MDKKTVQKVANLARLNLSEEQEDRLVDQLGNILGFVEQLDEVNTDNVEPLASVVEIKLPLRQDKVTDGGYPDAILANAPEESEDYFVISKVVE